jgi:hypothetical protein
VRKGRSHFFAVIHCEYKKLKFLLVKCLNNYQIFFRREKRKNPFILFTYFAENNNLKHIFSNPFYGFLKLDKSNKSSIKLYAGLYVQIVQFIQSLRSCVNSSNVFWKKRKTL